VSATVAVPAIRSSLLEPTWAAFSALLPERSECHPGHLLSCHRRRIPDPVVFDHIVEALVHGSATSASPAAPARTPRSAAGWMLADALRLAGSTRS